MKKSILLICLFAFGVAGYAQKTSFSSEAKKLEKRLEDWTFKNGYRLLIKFDLSNHASFYAEPNQDYAVFYIYDIDPNKEPSFKAYLMTPTDSLKEKYTAKPSEVAALGTAGGEMLQFATNKKMIGGAAKLPVKLEATPKAKMYVYRKTRKA